jgi:hypothetical protein
VRKPPLPTTCLRFCTLVRVCSPSPARADVRQAKPGARVVGQTNTDRSHAALKKLGIEPRVKAEATDEKFDNIIFCAPPSGSDDYQAEVRAHGPLAMCAAMCVAGRA